MKNTNRLVVAFGFLMLFLFSPGCKTEHESPVLVAHEKKYPELQKKYVYQSLIRLANVNKDPDFENLIRDIDKIVLYLPPEGDSTYQIKDVRSGLSEQGFETLVDVRTADKQRMSLWVKETSKEAHYIALADGEEDIILEIDGQVHIEYLSALTKADEGSLLNLLKGGF